MAIHVTLTNGVEARDFLRRLDQRIKDTLPALFRSLGDIYVADVKHRIISQDKGRWAPASKWLRAKKGHSRVLDGAERFIRARVNASRLAIVSTARGWSLTQHHDGFENQLTGPKDQFDDQGRVVLKLRDGRPLNHYVEMRRKRDGSTTPRASVFAFIATKAGVTPARKIWPNTDEAIRLGNPTASRWLNKVVREAGGSIVHG
jgi:hypothetical protein